MKMIAHEDLAGVARHVTRLRPTPVVIFDIIQVADGKLANTGMSCNRPSPQICQRPDASRWAIPCGTTMIMNAEVPNRTGEAPYAVRHTGGSRRGAVRW